MSADIHAYVEYADFKTFEGDYYWSNLTKNFGSRNYYLFGLLANVRGNDPALFDPRGLPEGRLGYETSADYWKLVAPEDKPEWADNGDGWVRREDALRWLHSGASKPDYDSKGGLRRVTDPDAHSASWLDTEELAKVLDHYAAHVQNNYPSEKPEAPIEWQAILAAMRSFESNGKSARVIFWFDN